MENLVSFLELNEKAKDNAEWEIRQRNKVAKDMEIKLKEITIYNSLFYTNGVFAKYQKNCTDVSKCACPPLVACEIYLKAN